MKPKGSMPAVLGNGIPIGVIRSLQVAMPDAKTRVFTYNGRRLFSHIKQETFTGERIYKLPTKIIEMASRQPLTSVLLPCRIGYSPNAVGQHVVRPDGDWAFTLLMCSEGKGWLDLPRSRLELRPGTFAVLRPFEYHAYQADADKPWSYYWVHFNGTHAQQYYDLLTKGGAHPTATVDLDHSFVLGFEAILGLYHDGHDYKALIQASAALHQLLGNVYALACRHGPAQPNVQERLEWIAKELRKNPAMQVSIHELAAATRMSSVHFSRQFRRWLGDSPRHYVNRQRVEKACEYLRDGELKIEAIARLVGCDDPAYFCRLFKRLRGCTPNDYRRNPGEAQPAKAP